MKGFSTLSEPLATRKYDSYNAYELGTDDFEEIKDRKLSPYSVTLFDKIPCIGKFSNQNPNNFNLEELVSERCKLIKFDHRKNTSGRDTSSYAKKFYDGMFSHFNY